jgi:hypothetical protein
MVRVSLQVFSEERGKDSLLRTRLRRPRSDVLRGDHFVTVSIVCPRLLASLNGEWQNA